MTARDPIPHEQLGPAERLFDLVLRSSAHLWHNRVGLEVGGAWVAAHPGQTRHPHAPKVRPGLFVPAAVELYTRLLEIYQLNAELMAHFASYALLETDWRDLKIACAALMLVQPRAGKPIRGQDGAIEFYEDDDRAVGEAMILKYEKGSARMMSPKAILRVAELLEVPEIAAKNRAAGFADPASRKAPLGRWKSAARAWLAVREQNPAMLDGLVKAGYKKTIKRLAQKSGYRPASQAFFEALGWKQTQSAGGHRAVGLGELALRKQERFDGMSEEEICERIVRERLGYKQTVGRLPKDIGLTPAIMVALLPSLSAKDLRILTPTLEELGLLAAPQIRERWEAAMKEAADQRSLHIARRVRSRELRDRLEEAADNAVKKAVEGATKDLDLHVMFLIDKSGSMQAAIAQSKEALARILAGFPSDKVHIASFDTSGMVLRPKAASRKAVEYMLAQIQAGGGTRHLAAVQAFHKAGVTIPPEAKLIVIVVGDEDGEKGKELADTFRQHGYRVDAMAMIVCVASGWLRGKTVRDCAAELRVPFCELAVEQFDDPYQVPRALAAVLEAPLASVNAGTTSRLIDKIMATPVIGRDVPV